MSSSGQIVAPAQPTGAQSSNSKCSAFDGKTPTPTDVKDRLAKHLAWLKELDGKLPDNSALSDSARLNFCHAKLAGQDLNNQDLRYADFRYADLSRAQLTSANLLSADFTGADLQQASLTGAKLGKDHSDAQGTMFTGANLRNLILDSPDSTQETASVLRSDHTKFAQLTGGNLTGAKLDYWALVPAKASDTQVVDQPYEGILISKDDQVRHPDIIQVMLFTRLERPQLEKGLAVEAISESALHTEIFRRYREILKKSNTQLATDEDLESELSLRRTLRNCPARREICGLMVETGYRNSLQRLKDQIENDSWKQQLASIEPIVLSFNDAESFAFEIASLIVRTSCVGCTAQGSEVVDDAIEVRRLYYWMGKALQSQRNESAAQIAAVESFRKAWGNSKNSHRVPEAAMELGRHYRLGHGVPKSNDASAYYYYSAGLAYIDSGRAEGAAVAIRSLETLNPDSPLADILNARLYGVGDSGKNRDQLNVFSGTNRVSPKSKGGSLTNNEAPAEIETKIYDSLSDMVSGLADIWFGVFRAGYSRTYLGVSPQGSDVKTKSFADGSPPFLDQWTLSLALAVSQRWSFVSIYGFDSKALRENIGTDYVPEKCHTESSHNIVGKAFHDCRIENNNEQDYRLEYNFVGLFYQPRDFLWLGVGPQVIRFSRIEENGRREHLRATDYVGYFSLNNAAEQHIVGRHWIYYVDVLYPIIAESHVEIAVGLGFGYLF